MKKVGILLLLSSYLFSLEKENAIPIVEKNKQFVDEAEKKLFTGIGKYIVGEGKYCRMNIVTVISGQPNGDFQSWSCDLKKLFIKGTVRNLKRVGLFETWDSKGKSTSQLLYNKEGKVVKGFSKYEGLEDLVYNDGKRTGWQIPIKDGSIEETKYYYNEDEVVAIEELEWFKSRW